jgi:hypothetical protein
MAFAGEKCAGSRTQVQVQNHARVKATDVNQEPKIDMFQPDGLVTRPMKRMLPERLSRIRNMNG